MSCFTASMSSETRRKPNREAAPETATTALSSASGAVSFSRTLAAT